jgi:hypothetical protein
MSTFYDLAIIGIENGIPVVPCVPRDLTTDEEEWKACKMKGDRKALATTDLKQIRLWNDNTDVNWERPYNANSNVGYMAIPKVGSPCYFEFDVARAEGMALAAKEMEQELPATRLDLSGKGFDHWIFTHTERSIKLGNRKARVKATGHEWFSFRANGWYIVGAGSTHPNGSLYTVANDIKPQPIPDWVCAFIEKYTTPEVKANGKLQPECHDDFDFEDLMDFFDIAGYWDGYWFIVDECPVAERKHRHSTKTGFFYDGTYLGWNDFAQGCDGSQMTVGKLIAYLNAKKGMPYKGVIWGQWKTAVELFDSDELEIDDNPSPEVAAIPVESTPEVTATAPVQFSLITEYADDFAGLEVPKPIEELPIPAKVLAVDPDYALAFPPEAAYGWLGKKASQLDCPLGWAYPAMLTIFAGQGVNLHKTDLEVRSNLYGCLIGPKGDGKSRTMNRALASMPYAHPEYIKKGVPGSEHGLVNLFCPPKPKKPPKGCEEEAPAMELFAGLLKQDEFRATLNKVAIQGSCLPTVLCEAFYDDEITASAVKQGVRSMLCRLSIIGGLKAADPQEFSEIFGSNTNDGLYDRFIFGVAKEGWEFDDEWRPNPEMRLPKGVSIPSFCFQMVKAWRAEGKACDPPKPRGRVGELALRVALVSASANHESEVSEACMRAALRFMEWQELIRATYEAGVAENQDAVITSAVMDKLKSYGKNPEDSISVPEQDMGHYKWVKWWPMYRRTNWRKRWGSAKMKYIKAAMIEEGTIEEEMKVVEDEGSKRVKPTGRVRFHG